MASFSGLVSKWLLLIVPKSLVAFIYQGHDTRAGAFTADRAQRTRLLGLGPQLRQLQKRWGEGSETSIVKGVKSIVIDRK